MNVWDKWNKWALVSPPSRPSRSQICAARVAIKDVPRGSPVCVLGSTIEYRSLLAREGFHEVCVIDKSPQFRQWTNQFLPPDVVGRERYIEGDWSSVLGDFPDTFSAIFSDLTIGNVHFDYQEPLLHLVAKALRPDGIFLDKFLHLGGKLHTVADIDHRFENCPISVDSANEFNCRAVFTSVLLEEFGCVDTARIYSALRQSIVNGNSRAILGLTIESITPEGCTWHYGPRTKKTREVYARLFSIQRTLPESRTSPYFTNCDFFCSTRRANGTT